MRHDAGQTAGHVEAVRHFNRFYTRQIGVLSEGLLDSPFSLAEARVLYELANRERPTAGEIGDALGLDAGYLSRILRRFADQKLLRRETSESDGRQRHLVLTKKGRSTQAKLDLRSSNQIDTMLRTLPSAERHRLTEAMHTIAEVLGASSSQSAADVSLRPHRPGDMGWVVHRHGVLYWQEYGWDERFEALVAGVVAKFIEHFDPALERCWIAEREGEIVGSVFLVAQSKTVAKLRLLYVEPSARGLGIGKRLVSECVQAARDLGYRKIVLWTQSELVAARGIYREAGFQLVREETHRSFGPELVAEVWELTL
jgi:DNA-binding MarR family transcriptional regulator/N-acetylglutamate synthase-like GNAT family acetyltransferase